jgi:hypothetical protein
MSTLSCRWSAFETIPSIVFGNKKKLIWETSYVRYWKSIE